MVVFAGEKTLVNKAKADRKRWSRKEVWLGRGRKQDSFHTLREKRVAKKLNGILRVDTDPLQAEFDSRLSVHICLLGHRKSVQEINGNSLVLTAVSVFNQRGRGGQACFRMNEWMRGGGRRGDAIASGCTSWLLLQVSSSRLNGMSGVKQSSFSVLNENNW